MANRITKYFLLGTGANFTAFDLDYGQIIGLGDSTISFKGNSGVDAVYVANGFAFDFTESLGGVDNLNLKGASSDYSYSYDPDAEVLTLTHKTIANTSIKMAPSDQVVFSNGAVTAQTIVENLPAGNAVFNTQLLDAGVTSPASAATFLSSTTGTDASTLKAFALDANGATFGQVPAGVPLIIKGNAGVDLVYVAAGSAVDFSESLGGEDKIFLTGNAADYQRAFDADSELLTLTRTVNTNLVEKVIVGVGDMLVFANGAATTDAVIAWAQGGSAPTLDTNMVTPGLADRVGSMAAIGGTATQGQLLTTGAISDDDTVTANSTTYQWQKADTADGTYTAIAGAASSSTYRLTQAEVGKFIKVVATYTDGHGPNKSLTSGATAVVADDLDPTIAGLPGTAQAVGVGQQAVLADFTVVDADSTNLTVTLTVTLTATNGAIGNVTDADANTAGIQLTGTATQINTALAEATFTANSAGAASIGVSVSDGVNTPVTGTYNMTAALPPSDMTTAPVVAGRTNLLPGSAQIGTPNNKWVSYFGVDEVSNAAIAPDGSRTAEALYGSAGGVGGAAGQSIYYDLGNNTTVTAGNTYTYSIYAKAGTMSTLRMAYDSNVHNQHEFRDVVFDLTRTSNTSGTGTAANTTWKQEVLSDGWHRLSLTMTAASAEQYLSLGFGVMPSGAGLDPASHVFVWGAQLEAGSQATAYIPTPSSTSNASSDATVTAAELNNGTFGVSVDASMARAGDKVEVGYLSNGTFTSFATPEYSAALTGSQAQLHIAVQSDTRLIAQDGTYQLATRLVDANGVAGAASAGVNVTFDTAVGATTAAPVFSGFTNLLPNSQAIGQTGWESYYGIDDTANQAAAPDGSMTADSLYAVAGGGATGNSLYYDLGSAGALQSGQTYTFSVYAKAGGVDTAQLAFGSTVNGTVFDLGTGLNASGDGWSQTFVGNGWYRLSVTKTLTASEQYISVGFGSNQAASGSNNIYMWGAQLETGSVATTYVPTQASTASSDTTITASELGLGVTVLVDASAAKAGDKVELGYLSNGAFTSFATPEYSDVLAGPQAQVAVYLDDPIVAGSYQLASRLVSPLDNLFGSAGAGVSATVVPGEIIRLSNLQNRVITDFAGDNFYALPASSGFSIRFNDNENDATSGNGINKISTAQNNLKTDFSNILAQGSQIGGIIQETPTLFKDQNGFLKLTVENGFYKIHIDRDGAAGTSYHFSPILELPQSSDNPQNFLNQIISGGAELKFKAQFNIGKTATSPFALEIKASGLDENLAWLNGVEVQNKKINFDNWKKISVDHYIVDLEILNPNRQIHVSAGGEDYKLDLPQGWYWKNNKSTDLLVGQLNGNNILYSDADILAEIKLSHYYDGFNLPKAVWEWLLNQRYHNTPIYFTLADRVGYSLINSLGFGICDDINTLYVQLMKSAGLDAKLALYPRHTLGEVFFQGRWQIFDADTNGVYLDEYGIPIGLDALEAHLTDDYENRLLNSEYGKIIDSTLNLGWAYSSGNLPFMGSLSSFAKKAPFKPDFLSLFLETPRFLEDQNLPGGLPTSKRIKLPANSWAEMIPSSEGKHFSLLNNIGERVPEVMYFKVYFDQLSNYTFDYPLIPVAVEGQGTVEILGDAGGVYQIGSTELKDKLSNYFIGSTKITVNTLSGLNSIAYMINPLRFYPENNFSYAIISDDGIQKLIADNEGMVVYGGDQLKHIFQNSTDQIAAPQLLKAEMVNGAIVLQFNQSLAVFDNLVADVLFDLYLDQVEINISNISIVGDIVKISILENIAGVHSIQLEYSDITPGVDDQAYVLQSVLGLDVKSFAVDFSADIPVNFYRNSMQDLKPVFLNMNGNSIDGFTSVNRQDLCVQLSLDMPLPGQKIEFWVDHANDGSEINDYKITSWAGSIESELYVKSVSNSFEFLNRTTKVYEYPAIKYEAVGYIDIVASGSYRIYAKMIDGNGQGSKIGNSTLLTISDEVLGQTFTISSQGSVNQPLASVLSGTAIKGTDVLIWIDANQDSKVNSSEQILGIGQADALGLWHIPIDMLSNGLINNVRAMTAPFYDRQTLGNSTHADFSAGSVATNIFSIYKEVVL